MAGGLRWRLGGRAAGHAGTAEHRPGTQSGWGAGQPRLAQFQPDAGLRVAWPLASATLLRVTLAEAGAYPLPADARLSAGVSITETTAGAKGEVQACIDNVNIRKTTAGLEISLPGTAQGNRLRRVERR